MFGKIVVVAIVQVCFPLASFWAAGTIELVGQEWPLSYIHIKLKERDYPCRTSPTAPATHNLSNACIETELKLSFSFGYAQSAKLKSSYNDPSNPCIPSSLQDVHKIGGMALLAMVAPGKHAICDMISQKIYNFLVSYEIT